jgi:tetratricopeptide (TPR) repeat protein
LKLNPHDVGALLGIGATLDLLYSGNQGVTYFKDVLQQPANTTAGKLQRALALTHLHNYTQALGLVDQLLPSVDTLNAKGVILLYQKNYTGSLFYLKKALKLSPHNPTIFYNMGLTNMFLGNYGAAIDNYNQVLKIVPNDKDALFAKKWAIESLEYNLYNKGKTLNDQGKYSEALIH